MSKSVQSFFLVLSGICIVACGPNTGNQPIGNRDSTAAQANITVKDSVAETPPQPEETKPSEPTAFDYMAKQTKPTMYTMGRYNIKELHFFQTDTFEDQYRSVVESEHFWYRINGVEYYSTLSTDNWNFLIPLKKLFMLPDSSLGILHFSTSGGFTTGSVGSGMEYLSVTAKRFSLNDRQVPYDESFEIKDDPGYFSFNISQEGSTVSFGDVELEDYIINNMYWNKDNSLSIIVEDDSGANYPKPGNTMHYIVRFVKAGDGFVVKVKKQK